VARNKRRVRKLGGPIVSRRVAGRERQRKEGGPMNGAGVRSSGSTCGEKPGEADDRTVQSTKETSASTINWGLAMPTSLWAIADKARVSLC
jgi:hypothetical protein